MDDLAALAAEVERLRTAYHKASAELSAKRAARRVAKARRARASYEASVISALLDHGPSVVARKLRLTKGEVAGICFRHGGLEVLRARERQRMERAA